MYIIHEENHDCLCVAESLDRAVLWLIKNHWLDGLTMGIDENDSEYQVKDIIKGSDKNEYLIFSYLAKLCRKDGIKAVLEWLEQFGFYFNDIEVA